MKSRAPVVAPVPTEMPTVSCVALPRATEFVVMFVPNETVGVPLNPVPVMVRVWLAAP